MSAEQYQGTISKPEKGNKFRAKRAEVDGISFDSKKEANRWLDLRNLERAGLITDLRRQVVIELQGRDGPLLTRTGRKMRITVDFAYVDLRAGAADGITTFEDAKGTPTRDYEVRKSVAEAQGIKIMEV